MCREGRATTEGRGSARGGDLVFSLFQKISKCLGNVANKKYKKIKKKKKGKFHGIKSKSNGATGESEGGNEKFTATRTRTHTQEKH